MSTGLMAMARTDQRDRIIADLRTENERLKQDLATARQDVIDERQGWLDTAEGVQNLRTALDPLHRALKQIFGEMERTGFESVGVGQKVSPVWESWKQKLDPQCGKAIDALLVHGGMTQTQLRIHVGCAQGSIYGVVCRLNKAGIINKNGGKISLKEL
jgi:hypothetical protein